MRRAVLLSFLLVCLTGAGTAARAAELTVCQSGCAYSNEQLQQAILDALPGDTILLQAGHIYDGTFRLPAAKACPASDASCYTTIETGVSATGDRLSASAFPPPDVRMTPGFAAVLAKLRSTVTNVAAMRTVLPGEVGPLCGAAPCVSRWWRLARIEVLPESRYQGGSLIELGSNSLAADVPGGDAQDLRSEVPSHFVLEQIYAHGDAVQGQFRGLYLHADHVTVKDSYISDIKSRSEGQGVTITNCAGPITITNTHLEGNGENLLAGGDGARAMQTQSVLASPSPGRTSARFSGVTDLRVGQWISVVAGGTAYSTVVRSITGTDVTFDEIPAVPDAPGRVRWGLVPGGLTFTKNHVYKPPSWRDPIVPAPGWAAAVPVAGTGALAAGTYAYRVVARREVAQNAAAYSPATPDATAVLAASGSVALSWEAVPDAVAYEVYGRTPGGQNLRWTVTASSTSFVDDGSAGTAGSIPAVSYWVAKNNFELKAMDGALIEGNVFDYSWRMGQVGYLVLFTVANTGGANDSTVIRDITFRGNRVRHGAGAMQMTAQDVSSCGCQLSGRLENVVVRDNVFEDIGTAWGSGVPAISISGPGTATLPRLGPKDLVFDHNTLVSSGTNKFLNLTLGQTGVDYTVENLAFTNNMTRRSTYGLRYDKSPGGMQAEGLTSWTLGAGGTSTFLRNVIAEANCSIYPSPGENVCPSLAGWQAEFVDFAGGNYRLLDGSAYRNAGTDGRSLGADIDAVEALTAIALSGDNRTGTPPPPPPPPPDPLVIATTSLPDGLVGTAYSAQLLASGGAPPYTWSASAGLPAGLALSASGVVSGTPESAGTFQWTTTVTDARGTSAASTLTVLITAPPPPPPSPLTAPANLTATVSGRNRVLLTWQDTTDRESGFEIETSTDGVSFTRIATVAAGTTSYTATGVNLKRVHHFRVRASAGDERSPYSNVVTVGGNPSR